MISAQAFAGGVPDACESALPPALVRQLGALYPEHRTPRVNDNADEDVAYAMKKGASPCLGVASADFDGNGARDFAVLLTPKATAAAVTVAALRRGQVYAVQTLREWEDSDRSVLYVAVLRPGRFTRTPSADGPLEPGEVREVRTTLMGVATGQTESTEIGYFYRGGKWIHVWIAD